jgi:hypothetical protein
VVHHLASEATMNSIKRTIIGLYRILTLSATAYVLLKISRYFRKGKVEKKDTDSGQGENFDAVLSDAEKTFK